MSNEAKCDCQHCGGHIAFPSEAAGQTVECPHCKNETLLFLPPDETSQFVSCSCQHCNQPFEFDASKLVEENSLVPCPYCGQETKLVIPQKTDDSNSDAPGETDAPAQQTDSIAKAEAAKALRAAQMKQCEEIITEAANSMRIYSNLDTLELRGDTVTITKRGLANALASGMNGARTIQISSITAVQMKPAGMFTPGYILFSYAGSKPFMGGVWEATQDPDTFLFGKDLTGEVAEFKALVEKKMRESKQPAPAPANNSSGTLTDELRKLAEFKNQGILSQAEFEAAKKKLLA
jgi:Zn finger protein HypA/HybF involved in hydrogenase expression